MMLWRPVGLAEMGLVFDSCMRRFPPRLPEQPIFYPVLADLDAARFDDCLSSVRAAWSARALAAPLLERATIVDASA